MQFLSVLAFVASVAAVAIPGDEWKTWSSSSVCPTSTVYSTEYSTDYSTVYSTETCYETETDYSTVYSTETCTETDYVTKTETDYMTVTPAPVTVYSTEWETYTMPCTSSKWGSWK